MVHRGDFPRHVLDLIQQPLQDLAVDRDRTPRHGGVDQHTDQRRMLEGLQLLFAEAHRLASAQLAVAQIMQRLGDDGLIERMG